MPGHSDVLCHEKNPFRVMPVMFEIQALDVLLNRLYAVLAYEACVPLPVGTGILLKAAFRWYA